MPAKRFIRPSLLRQPLNSFRTTTGAASSVPSTGAANQYRYPKPSIMPSACCQCVRSVVFAARPASDVQYSKSAESYREYPSSAEPELQRPPRGSEKLWEIYHLEVKSSVQFENSVFKACPASKFMPQQTEYIDSSSVCSGEGIAVDLRGLAGAIVAVGRV